MTPYPPPAPPVSSLPPFTPTPTPTPTPVHHLAQTGMNLGGAIALAVMLVLLGGILYLYAVCEPPDGSRRDA